MKSYTYQNKGIMGRNGKDLIKLPITQKTGELSTEVRHIFLVIMNEFSFRTLDDSIQGGRLADAIDEAEDKDTIVLGEGVYDWVIKKMVETNKEGNQILPYMFRVNGSVVHEFIKDGFNKPHEPAAKAEGKKGEDAPATEEPGESRPEED